MVSSKRLTLTLVTTNSQTLAMTALNSKARLPQCFWQLSNTHRILASLSPTKDENCFPLRLTLAWDLRKLAVTVPTGSKIRLFAETGSPATSHHCLGQNQIKATKRSHPRSFLWPRDVLRYLGTKEVLYCIQRQTTKSILQKTHIPRTLSFQLCPRYCNTSLHLKLRTQPLSTLGSRSLSLPIVNIKTSPKTQLTPKDIKPTPPQICLIL